MVIEAGDTEPIILDLGTGLRGFGCALAHDGVKQFAGTALISHLHWDHVQGLPFFAPMVTPGSRINIYGPTQDDGRSFAEAVDDFMRPPYFPVSLRDLPAHVDLHECPTTSFRVGAATITAAEVPHCGTTLGFRIEAGGVVVAYVPDHQQPQDGSYRVAESVLRLCAGADLVIHDAQFTDEEFAVKSTWGHCTVDYAVQVALQSGAKRLALFHHDPGHSDDEMDELVASAVATGARNRLDVFAAVEGLKLQLRAARYARLS